MTMNASTSGNAARRLFTAAAAAIFAFLYLPLIVLVAFSFQESRILAWPIESWSLHWYRVLWQDAEMIAAVGNSLFVATACVVITTVVGVPLALTLRRLGGGMRTGVERALLLPLIIPQLITGLALLIILHRVDVGLSLGTVILGQSLVWMPIVVTQVLARLERVNPNLEKASMDLGAGMWQTFFLVTLPSIRTAIIGSALLVFTLSFDELPVTFFLTGSRNTLPMHIWSMLRIGITPEINAIATVTVGVSIILILAGIRLLARERGRP
ncbi:Inner membrane ABC transporter permease protein YdcV [wastewater metagenome]|uniref:Inner membrane ABC transporter permease protein YdcV n=3 Tax=root TaxID=1 RepID=A0A5B8RFJ3_9ZZZZ|nr:inner membrane ABC transporter permease protein YdcV [uncultured organism]